MTDATTEIGLDAIPRREGRRRLAIVLSMVLILAAAGSALFIVRGVDAQLNDIGNTYEVRRQARELIFTILEVESGQRGYLLTVDPRYLDPYYKADAAIDEIYSGLLKLVENNPGQKARVEAMRAPLEEKRAETRRTIELAGAGRLTEALEIVRTDEGRELMSDVRKQISDFTAEEDIRLLERNSSVEQPRQWLVITILAALAASATLAYVLFTRTQREVSTLARTSSNLMSQNELLEQRVRERTAELEDARNHAERERERVETLLQDTNHRIGNSLATVSSLLGLQVTRSKSDEVREALEGAQSRVLAIASGHRRLRLGSDLESANAAEFLEAVVEDIRSTLPEQTPVAFHTDLRPMVIDARDATTLGIVVGELLTNALKHAFPDGRSGSIWVRLGRNGDSVPMLTVEDDGKGLPQGTAGESGLGAMIIRQLARQFGGEPSYGQREGGGTIVTVTLPKVEMTKGTVPA